MTQEWGPQAIPLRSRPHHYPPDTEGAQRHHQARLELGFALEVEDKPVEAGTRMSGQEAAESDSQVNKSSNKLHGA